MPDDAATVLACDQPRVFLVHARRTEDQQIMERARLERIWMGPKLHAYFCSGRGSTGG